MNKLLPFLIAIILIANPALAKSALDLGLAGVGARPMGMGKAFVAIADDANAVFLNPGGLALSKTFKATSMSANLLQMVDYRMAGASLPTQYGTIGFGYISLSSPAGYLTTDKVSISSLTPINLGASEMIFSYGNSLGGLAAGANLKLISNNFSGTDGGGTGYGLDLGMINKIDDNINFGANLQNIVSSIVWASKSAEKLPSLLKLGVSNKVAGGKVVLAADIDYAISDKSPLVLHSGVEVKPTSYATLRGGIDQYAGNPDNLITNFTAGIGLNFNDFCFDYAYHGDQNIGDNATHYFSISFASDLLNGKSEKAQAVDPGIASKLKAQRDFGIISGGAKPILKYYQDGNSLKASNDDILKYYR